MDKLAGIKPGDRVRVTLEGEVASTGSMGGLGIIIAPDCGNTPFYSGDVNAPTFRIEKLATPLKVGDRVRFASNEMSTTGVILAFDPHPVIRFEPPSGGQYYDSVNAEVLERVS